MPYHSKSIKPLTSIVSYPERGDGGDNRYRGNCSPKLIEDLIGFFKPKEICDYMCGSGTTKAAADKAGIRSRLCRDRKARHLGEYYHQGAAQLLFGPDAV